MALKELQHSDTRWANLAPQVTRTFDAVSRSCDGASVCQGSGYLDNYRLMHPGQVREEAIAQRQPGVTMMYLPVLCYLPKSSPQGQTFSICTNMLDQLNQSVGDNSGNRDQTKLVHHFKVDLMGSDPSMGMLIGDFDGNGCMDVAFRQGEAMRIFLGDRERIPMGIISEDLELFPSRENTEQPYAPLFRKSSRPARKHTPLTFAVGNFWPQKAQVEAMVRQNWDILKANFPKDGRINPFEPYTSPVGHGDPVFVIETEEHMTAKVTQLTSSAATKKQPVVIPYEQYHFPGTDVFFVTSSTPSADGNHVFHELQQLALLGFTADHEALNDPHVREELLIQMALRLVVVAPIVLSGADFSMADIQVATTEQEAARFLRTLQGKLPANYNWHYLEDFANRVLNPPPPPAGKTI